MLRNVIVDLGYSKVDSPLQYKLDLGAILTDGECQKAVKDLKEALPNRFFACEAPEPQNAKGIESCQSVSLFYRFASVINSLVYSVFS